MNKTPSYLAFESLIDLSRKAAIAKNREYDENENYFFCRSFTDLSWYSRVNINSMPVKDEEMLKKIVELCSEPDSPKYLSLAKEDMYEGFEDDLFKAGFVIAKPQKGMLYDLFKAPEYKPEPNVISVPEENIDEWIAACEGSFKKSGTAPAFKIFAKDKDCHFYGYMKDGKMVSCALLNVTNVNGGIHEVGTYEEYRGNGYASALIKTIIREAPGFGCNILSLQASVFGEPVYKRLGFEIVSEIANYKR